MRNACPSRSPTPIEAAAALPPVLAEHDLLAVGGRSAALRRRKAHCYAGNARARCLEQRAYVAACQHRQRRCGVLGCACQRGCGEGSARVGGDGSAHGAYHAVDGGRGVGRDPGVDGPKPVGAALHGMGVQDLRP